MKSFYSFSKLSLLALFLISIVSFQAQATSLGAGDLAITSINMDSNDEFSFVLLTDISGTTTVYFTENGWNDVSNNWGNTSEGTIVWTYTGTANCGDEIQITSPKSSPRLLLVPQLRWEPLVCLERRWFKCLHWNGVFRTMGQRLPILYGLFSLDLPVTLPTPQRQLLRVCLKD